VTIFENISKLITSHNTATALQLSLLQKNNYCCAFLAANPFIQLRILLPGYTGFNHSAGQIELPPCPGTLHSLPFQTFVCVWEQPAQTQWSHPPVGQIPRGGEGGRSGNSNSGANATRSFVEYRTELEFFNNLHMGV
jgi:hypothetical protein